MGNIVSVLDLRSRFPSQSCCSALAAEYFVPSPAFGESIVKIVQTFFFITRSELLLHFSKLGKQKKHHCNITILAFYYVFCESFPHIPAASHGDMS